MASGIFPRRNLPGEADAWGRHIELRIKDVERDSKILDQTVNNAGRADAGSLAVMSAQIEKLIDAGQVYQSSVGTTWTGVTSWVTPTPSVSASSLSGRFQVSVYGGSAAGTSYFTFAAPGYDRERAKGGTASAINSRVSALGGASTVGSAYRSWVVSLAPRTVHTFSAEGWCDDAYTSMIGLGITVQPLL